MLAPLRGVTEHTIKSLHEAIERALELLCKLPGSTLGVQLERLRLGTTSSTRRPDACEDAAIYHVDTTHLGVLRGLTGDQQLAIYLRHYWRPTCCTVERRVRGKGGKTVLVEQTRSQRSTADQCAAAMGLELGAYVALLRAAHDACRANAMSTTAQSEERTKAASTTDRQEEWACSTT